ncbi:hypothetical protein [Aureivirga sp. CE67]|uniref:hypothetical protein n=1 Tax=Aureivirga sp. CE67 TaxID=1788983 RepID=UPI0018C95DD9|nr:hypothetical protein [Aureivirga sp. CE67]
MNIEQTKHIDKNKTLVNSFISIIQSYVIEIQNAPEENKKALKGGLDIALRILTGSHASYVSQKVLDHLNEKNIKVNPFDLIWEQRNLMGHVEINNRKYSMAVWEHTIPIKQFREELIKIKDKDLIEKAIYQYPGVAWISREEDIKLNKLGFQTKRPGGFLECYRQAGISLIHEQNYCF